MRYHFLKLYVFIGLFAGSLYAQEKKEIIQPTQKPTYTLVGSDGSQVKIDQELIKKYAPGLAELFKPGFKEGETNQIIVSDLDKIALEDFKKILEQIELLQTKALEQVQEQNIREALQKAALFAQYSAQTEQVDAIQKKVIKELQIFIENLPNLGEYLLKLLNQASFWRIYYLENALARIATEQIEYTPENIKKFFKIQQLIIGKKSSELEAFTKNDESAQNLFAIWHMFGDPQFSLRAKLVYLFNIPITPANCELIYQLLEPISKNPGITHDPEIQRYFDLVILRITKFTADNIEKILAIKPNLKQFFAQPEMKLFADSLRTRLIKIIHEKKLSRIILRTRRLENEARLIALTDHTAAIIEKEVAGLLVKISELNLNSDQIREIMKIPFTDFFTNIQVIQLSTDHILVYNRFSEQKNVYIFDKKLNTTNSVDLSSKITSIFSFGDNITAVLLANNIDFFNFVSIKAPLKFRELRGLPVLLVIGILNSTQFLLAMPSHLGSILELRTFLSDKPLHIWKLNGQVQNIIKLDEETCIITLFEKFSDQKKNNQTIRTLLLHEPWTISENILTNPLLSNYNRAVCSIVEPLNLEYGLCEARQGRISQEYSLTINNLKTDKSRLLTKDASSHALLNRNHIFTIESNQLILYFIPETASLSELLDEIQKNLPSAPAISKQMPQPTPAPVQKAAPKRKTIEEEEEEITLAPAEEQEMTPEEFELIQQAMKKSKLEETKK